MSGIPISCLGAGADGMNRRGKTVGRAPGEQIGAATGIAVILSWKRPKLASVIALNGIPASRYSRE